MRLKVWGRLGCGFRSTVYGLEQQLSGLLNLLCSVIIAHCSGLVFESGRCYAHFQVQRIVFDGLQTLERRHDQFVRVGFLDFAFVRSR
jgi:hypothetical protein